jgi:hypothetical protein
MTKQLFVDIDEDFEEDDFVNARNVVIEHLFKHEVKWAEIRFSGGDDGDSVDEVVLYFNEGTMLRLNGGGNYGHITNALCTPVYAEVDFPSIEYITGKVTWSINYEDSKKSYVKIESSEQIESFIEVSKEL